MTSRDCAAVELLISPYLDMELDVSERGVVEQHIAVCNACSALLDDVAMIRRDAAALPLIVPQGSLWEVIEARIAAPVVELPSSHAGGARRSAIGTAFTAVLRERKGMLAGALLGAAAASLIFLVASGRSGVMDPALDSAATSVASLVAGIDTADVRLAALAASARVFQGRMWALEAALRARGPSMDSTTRRVVRENLQVIDAAIRECMQALARSPDSELLQEELRRALSAKVAVLQSVLTLPTGAN